ncbi:MULTISPECIES: hypothetical protein [unclassified Pseudodesulfovibrio]|uniref:hypothetical protein n=1 Tax=unclassified Pseudodesulfovibrio TaxID=2661612 RepID=UPI000FEB670E|nr:MULTISPECIES: hypothetical protein [unclassified Pseudodesulfovibrio]MCJ2164881.1 transporter substrate-binding domain-containing protein [Pseudodesulfovibrio sp. S3-i]RWU03751.1 hypothetical protein DWB63_09845 [Pseudodesulfovibrio sp. S3]
MHPASVILLLALILGLPSHGYCLDEIKILPGSSDKDRRQAYPNAVLIRILEVTRDSDGPYRITLSHLRMTQKRALSELVSGEHVNVIVVATCRELEDKALPIRIPVLRGLLSYRLLLINGRNLDKFKCVDSLEALKRLKGGSGMQWTITKIFRHNGFALVTGNNYEGLFCMLDFGRFDYFSRGVNEIFEELQLRKKCIPDLCIEPNLALYCPMPCYFFVSPAYPKLADRIRRGMEIISANGELDALFQKHFGTHIARARLKERTVFKIDNPLLSDETPLDRPELWFTP